jgi:predicted regulator of Ras-like GTPase activity (Roadblock/LC7/MglB family)
MESGPVLPAQFLEEVELQLSRFYEKTAVSIVLLIDESGQLISYKGEAESVDLACLAALVASDMAAVTEMARLLGERDRVKLLFHEGETYNILTSAVKGSFFLVSIFKTSVQIGLVRLFSKEAMSNLLKIVEQIETTSAQVAPLVDMGFTTSLADELERAFGE